jgi:hypothetical protein
MIAKKVPDTDSQIFFQFIGVKQYAGRVQLANVPCFCFFGSTIESHPYVLSMSNS